MEVAQEERFEEPVDPCLSLTEEWCLWEQYEGGDYDESMKKVAWFNDVLSFAQAWKNLPHRDIGKFFYNHDNKSVQM